MQQKIKKTTLYLAHEIVPTDIPEMLELGLLVFVQSRSRASDDKLFPEVCRHFATIDAAKRAIDHDLNKLQRIPMYEWVYA